MAWSDASGLANLAAEFAPLRTIVLLLLVLPWPGCF